MPCIPFCPLFNLQIRIIKCLKVEIHLNSVSQKHINSYSNPTLRVVSILGERLNSTQETRAHSRLGGRGNATRAPRLFFYFSTSLTLYNMGAVSQTRWKINTNGLQRINRELLFSCCRQSLTRGISRCPLAVLAKKCIKELAGRATRLFPRSVNRRLLSSVITSVDSSYILLQLSRMNECRVTHLVLFEI